MSTAAKLKAARFYAILDTGYTPRPQWREVCSALIAGGAGVVQVRAKREDAEVRAALLEEVLPLFTDPDAPLLVVNDDLELARRHPGIGLHIGQTDTPPALARESLGPDRLLGLSTHSRAQAKSAIDLAAGVLDYFAVGPVFPTATKPDYTPVGLQLVSEVAALRPRLPWFCIGGITRSNAREVVAAGARRVVVVSDVLTDPDPAGVIRAIVAHLPLDS